MVNQQLFLLFLISSFIGAVGCAARAPASSPVSALSPVASLSTARAAVPPAGDRAESGGLVFATIEDAVRDAFEAAEARSGLSDRDRLQVGTIRRIAGGFVWTEPVRSPGSIRASAPPRARLRLGPDDVAVYSVHPRSGHADLDRLNEAVGAGERRLVDEQDPLHRPLFVRTPSRRILRYPGPAERSESLEVVRAN